MGFEVWEPSLIKGVFNVTVFLSFYSHQMSMNLKLLL